MCLFALGCRPCAEFSSAEACQKAPSFRQTPTPLDPSNAYETDQTAIQFGFKLFFDARLSAEQELRCASCHSPESFFHDRSPTPRVVEGVFRNSQTLINAADHRTWMWDGRADSLWAQPILAIESPIEMNLSRLELAHRIAMFFSADYESIFGPLPDMSAWPKNGVPGEANFDGLAETEQNKVNRIMANVSKALAAYQRKLAGGPAAFDRFLDGETASIGETARRGFEVFVERDCDNCHGGGHFSDDQFYRVFDDDIDLGRRAGTMSAADTFSRDSVFADAEALAFELKGEGYRTPSLRNINLSGPYAHDGRFLSIDEAVMAHGEKLTSDELELILEFLKTLDGAYPAAPYNDWPEG